MLGGTDSTGTDGNPGAGSGSSGGTAIYPGGTGEGTAQEEPFVIPEWADGVIWVLVFLLMIPLQGEIRIAWKRSVWNSGTPN